LLAPPAGFNPKDAVASQQAANAFFGFNRVAFSSAAPRDFHVALSRAGELPPGIFHAAQGNVNLQPAQKAR